MDNGGESSDAGLVDSSNLKTATKKSETEALLPSIAVTAAPSANGEQEEGKITVLVHEAGVEEKGPKGSSYQTTTATAATTSTKQVKILDPMEARKQLGECKEEDPAMARVTLKVYPRRWLVLAIVALLNNSNAMSWISYSPVANHVDAFYGRESAANYFSLIYLAITIPVGFAAMWGERRFGLRWAIIIAALANGSGSLIRLASNYVEKGWRFPVGIIGQGIAGVAYPFIMFLPSKVAAVWFPERQRALATTIGLMANPLGIFLANIISPNVVSRMEHVPYINIITVVPATLIAVMAIVFVRRSKPKLPPSISASTKSFDFIKGLTTCLTSRQYLILLLVMGGGMGMFNSLYTLMQQLLCPSGYPNTFAGTCAALMITGGVLGAFLSGTFVDRTKMYDEAIKGSMTAAVISGLLFLQLSQRQGLGLLISIVAFAFGIAGMAAYPVGLELAAECTFPVTATTSSGLIVIVGQIQSVLYIKLMEYFATPLSPENMEYQVCTAPGVEATDAVVDKAKDWNTSVIVMSAVAVSLVIVLFALFRPKLRRSAAERGRGVHLSVGGGKKTDGSNGGLLEVDEIDKPADAEAQGEEMDLREAKPQSATTEELGASGEGGKS